MSINSAMLAGVSGLVANSAALATTSDNIANANTVGYKTVQSNFSDLVTSSSLTGDYSAGGVLASTRQLVNQQGNLTQTSSNTDLAISGQGFFVTTNNATPSITDTRNFTRAGSFTLDKQGYLQNSAGGYLQGWPVNSDGSVTVNPSNLAGLQTINVGNVGGVATATKNVSLNANLNASQTVSAAGANAATWGSGTTSTSWNSTLPAGTTSVTYNVLDNTGAVVATQTKAVSATSSTADSYTWNGVTSSGGSAVAGNSYSLQMVATNATGTTLATTEPSATYSSASATNSMAAYNAGVATGTKPDFTISVPVSDSQGGQRTLQLDMLKSSDANTWYGELVATPASSVQDGAGLNNGQVAAGSVVFNSDGSINMSSSTLFQSPAFTTATGSTTPVLNIGASSTASSSLGAGQVAWGQGLGIAGSQINLNVNTAPGGLTQYASASVTQSVTTDGTQFGNLTNVQIDNQGFVTAVYDNGVSRKIAQVALATFENPDGLKSVSGNNYQVSATSGTYNLKVAGTGGAGTISPSQLESSTVDLSQQFASLITTQQAYSASTKIITTSEQMLQALISIKQ